MRFATISKLVVMGLAVLLAASAFAGTPGTKGDLQLTNAVTVNGTTLNPGEYKLQWEGAGPNVELSFIQGKKVIAKVPAHVVELESPAANDAAVIKSNGNATGSLSAVRFQGKKTSLDLTESSASMAGGSNE